MKVAVLKYSDSFNIGDEIQSLAVAQHIDQEFGFVERDYLSGYDGDPCVVVMNGWFTHNPQNWPPSPNITPIFFGFHIIPKVAEELAKHKDYFRRFAPIGCRDQATADVVKSWGVDAYVSGCATMTFPTRTVEPASPKVYLVDEKRRYFRGTERRRAIKVGHKVARYLSAATRFEYARDLLNFYRENAGLVVTTRIHCAIPCAALGIPAIYTGVREGRTAIVDRIGIPAVELHWYQKRRFEDLPIKRPAFEDTKHRLIEDLHKRLRDHGVKVRTPR